MFCAKCGSEVKIDQARFCWNCGAALQPEVLELQPEAVEQQSAVEETCLVVCAEIREKWSFFGKDVSVFRAIPENSEDEKVIAQSKEFIVTGFNYEGPSKNNKIHLEAFNELEEKLEKKGWRRDVQYGPHWYTIRFKK
jgi:hypothetical protein